MARIFLDTNYYVDLVKRKKGELDSLKEHLLFISPVSPPVLFYLYKIKVPNEEITQATDQFGIVALTKYILDNSMQGPTNDLEDNIQLHSAAEAECDYFLTLDKKLRSIKFFGKTRIADKLIKNE